MTQPASIELLNRSSTVTVGHTQIANIGQKTKLNVWFSVRRSLRPLEPNTCDVKLWGLSDDTRKAIAASTTGTAGAIASKGKKSAGKLKASASAIVPAQIEAGYIGGTSIIFLGQMRTAQTVTDGPDTVTELTTGDGDEATLLSRSTAAFGTGATAYTVAQTLLADMGIGQGNTATVQSTLRASQMFSNGVVLKGNSLEHLVDLAQSVGLEVSIQHGVAQWTKLGQPLGGTAYLLNADSGLIGSPSVDTKGVLTLQTLMIPGMAPGRAIKVDAKYVQGVFRIISITTTGDTAGNDWNHDIEAKPYGLGVY